MGWMHATSSVKALKEKETRAVTPNDRLDSCFLYSPPEFLGMGLPSVL